MEAQSIAATLVAVATREAVRAGGRVAAVHFRLGALAGVAPRDLRASYEAACQGTPLKGSRLIIQHVPLVVYCDKCGTERVTDIAGYASCSDCGAPLPEVRSGREFDVIALEIRQ